MLIPNLVVYGTLEVFAVMLLLSLFLAVNSRGLKKTIRVLEKKVTDLTKSLKQAKKATKKAIDEFTPAKAYKKLINDQIAYTKAHHKSLKPNNDIALDLDLKNPQKRQTAALRHTFLIAEKESALSGKGGKPNWNVLDTKLGQLIQFYELAFKDKFKASAEPPPPVVVEIEETGPSTAEILDEFAEEAPGPSIEDAAFVALQQELDGALKRVDNLEQFRKLFFEMEENWDTAKTRADEYYEDLMAMVSSATDPTAMEMLVNSYQEEFQNIDVFIQKGRTETPFEAPAKVVTQQVGNVSYDASPEVDQLLKVNEEQRKMIADLRFKIQNATTPQQKDVVIADLQLNLTKLEQFLSESQTCIKLLEDELNTAKNNNINNTNKMKAMKLDLMRVPQLEKLVKEFTLESRDMLGSIASLERDGSQLIKQLESGSGGSSEHLSELQNKLIKLQSQHTDLEERYLELKNQ